MYKINKDGLLSKNIMLIIDTLNWNFKYYHIFSSNFTLKIEINLIYKRETFNVNNIQLPTIMTNEISIIIYQKQIIFVCK